MYGKSLHFSAKAAVYSALDRLKKVPGKSIAVLVPSKRLMLEFIDYLSSSADSLPELHHDVAMFAEPPALAAGVIATLLEGGKAGDMASRSFTRTFVSVEEASILHRPNSTWGGSYRPPLLGKDPRYQAPVDC
jgi:hypothetical protein